MIVRLFFLVGLVCVILSLAILSISFFVPQQSSAAVLVANIKANGTPGGTGGGPGSCHCIAEHSVNTLFIEKYWPNQMDFNTSDSIRILLRIQGEGYSLATTTATMGNYSLAKENPLPLPYGWSIRNAFGSHAEPFATAHLVATTFNVQSSGLDERALDIPGVDAVEWDWNISPKNLGTQVFNANIDLVWKSKNNGQVIQQVRIWQSIFDIKVTQPFFDKNQLTASALASAALGLLSILTSIITWCLTQIGKRWDERADKRKEQASKDLEGSGSSPALIASPSTLPSPASASQTPSETNVTLDLSAHRSTSTVTPTPPPQQGTLRHARLSKHPPIPLVLLTLGCAFLALLAGGGALIYYSSVLGSAQFHSQATPIATPTVNIIAAEAQSTYTETTRRRPTNTYSLGSNSTSIPWLIQRGTGYSCTFAGGAYHIYVSAKGTTDSCQSGLDLPQYFTFQVQMRIIKGDYGGIGFQNFALGDRGGIGFQMNYSPGEAYAFRMKSDGSYDLSSSSRRLQSGSLGMMHTGLDQSNVIAIMTDASNIYFFVNHQFVTSTRTTPTAHNLLALLGGSASNYPVDVSFSNAQLWIPLSG